MVSGAGKSRVCSYRLVWLCSCAFILGASREARPVERVASLPRAGQPAHVWSWSHTVPAAGSRLPLCGLPACRGAAHAPRTPGAGARRRERVCDMTHDNRGPTSIHGTHATQRNTTFALRPRTHIAGCFRRVTLSASELPLHRPGNVLIRHCVRRF